MWWTFAPVAVGRGQTSAAIATFTWRLALIQVRLAIFARKRRIADTLVVEVVLGQLASAAVIARVRAARIGW